MSLGLDASSPLKAPSDEDDVLTNLYPALTQCFFVIFVGYLIGRIKLIPSGGIKGFAPPFKRIFNQCPYAMLPSSPP